MVWRSKRFSIWSGLYGGLGWFGRSPSPVKSKGFCSPGVILFAASNCRKFLSVLASGQECGGVVFVMRKDSFV
ncbi:hypothetical protein YC2023_061789 [Brassica napus]